MMSWFFYWVTDTFRLFATKGDSHQKNSPGDFSPGDPAQPTSPAVVTHSVFIMSS